MTNATNLSTGTHLNMTKTPQPAPPSPAPAAPASSTPIYDALVREWYAEGRNPGARRGGETETDAGGEAGAESSAAA